MASVFSNGSSVSNLVSLDVARGYAWIGTGGMIINAFILTILLTDRKFLCRFSNMVGIAISHFLCSLAIGATGFYRVVNYSRLNQTATAWSCMQRVYPALLPVAFQSMGLMLIVIGLERFSVFMLSHWYKAKWTDGMAWRAVGLAYGIVLLSIPVGLYQAWHQPMTTLSCLYSSVCGSRYIIYSCSLSATGGCVAVIFTMIGLIKGSIQARSLPLLSGEAGRCKRQLRLTRLMLSVAICDFCLVVIPNVVYILVLTDFSISKMITVGNLSNFSNIAYCINSILSLLPSLAFNKQFRRKVRLLLGCKKQAAIVTPHGQNI